MGGTTLGQLVQPPYPLSALLGQPVAVLDHLGSKKVLRVQVEYEVLRVPVHHFLPIVSCPVGTVEKRLVRLLDTHSLGT